MPLPPPPRGETRCDGAGSAEGGGATGRAAAAVSPFAAAAPSAVDLAEPIGENSAEFAGAAAPLSLEGRIFSFRVFPGCRERSCVQRFFFLPSTFLSLFGPAPFISCPPFEVGSGARDSRDCGGSEGEEYKKRVAVRKECGEGGGRGRDSHRGEARFFRQRASASDDDGTITL